jgi:predicted DCC family thiol-disulfide oxidoreductase YuxK
MNLPEHSVLAARSRSTASKKYAEPATKTPVDRLEAGACGEHILVTVTDSPRHAPQRGEHLVLYDGVCGLCNRLNQFVLERDRRAVFDFASLQSAAGRSAVQRFGRNPDHLDTFHVVTNYRSDRAALLSKSRAALFVIKTIGGGWTWLRTFGVLPEALLDRGYDLIARHRYRLFGRSESCLMPSADYKTRFIDV